MTEIKVNLPAVEISEKNATFIQRVLGPVAEVSDFLSEKVRFHRWRSSLRVLDEARIIADEHGIEPNEVPLKTLVPLLEKASLEEEDSELIKVWANLLANAAADEESVHPSFSSILSRLGPRDVSMLDAMVDRSTRSYMERYLNDTGEHGSLGTGATVLSQASFDALTDSIFAVLADVCRQNDADAIRKAAFEWSERKTVFLWCRSISVQRIEGDEVKVFALNSEFMDRSRSAGVLVSNGLIREETKRRELGDYRCEITVLVINALGFELATACQPPKVIQ